MTVQDRPPVGRLTLLCAITPDAWHRLQSPSVADWSTQAANALHDATALLPDLATLTGERVWCREGLRYRGVTVPASVREEAQRLAALAFGGRRDWAAGWLIGRGLGVPYSLPAAPPATPAPVVPPTAPAIVGAAAVGGLDNPRDNADYWRVKPRLVAPPVRKGEAPPEGAALQARREALGLSQRDFAPLVGVSRGTISGVESGYRPHPATRQLVGDVLTRLERERQEESQRAPSGATLLRERQEVGLSKAVAARLAGVGLWHATEAETREEAAGAVMGARHKLHALYTRLLLERAARQGARP